MAEYRNLRRDPTPPFNKQYPLDRNTGLRSEAADFAQAAGQLPGNPPVTIMEGLFGDPQYNGVREAIRQSIIDRMNASRGSPGYHGDRDR